MRLPFAAALLLIAATASASAARGDDDAATIRVEPEISAAVPARKTAAMGKARVQRVRRFELVTPTAAELAQFEAPANKGAPPKIGFPRPIASLQGDGETGRALDWETLQDGAQVAAVSVTSPGAAALRLGLRVRSVPADAVFRFHGGDEVFEASGAEVLATIARNLAAGEDGDDARTYWSPVIEASTAVLEIELPPGSARGALRMSVPLASHIVASVKEDFLLPKAAAGCNRDAMCQSSWAPQMNAVARMAFSAGGYTYTCTGTLLADNDTSTAIPYFLTANHCINSQASASSLVNYWFYRSSACNSGTPGAYAKQTGGATLLYHGTATDVSFLQLNTTPPGGVTYAGWKAGSPVALSSAVTGLHHPTGDLLKISSGSVLMYLVCSSPTDGQFSCSRASSASSATFYDVGWASGVVEPGSSGSAIFDAGKYVVGQLYGGGSTCSDPRAGDAYGRFDVAFASGISQWLNAPPAVKHALTIAKAGSGTGYVGSSPPGIDCGDACSSAFVQGGTVTLSALADAHSTFGGWSGACSGLGGCTLPMSGATGVTASFVPRIAGSVAAEPAALVFGNTLGTQTVTFTNDSTARVTFLGASVSSARYRQSNNCGVLDPGASCVATVTYSPFGPGSADGILTVSSTAGNSPHGVALSAAAKTAASDARLTGISTRMRAATGNDVMIGGFIVGGAGVKTVVVRARGPSLATQGLTGLLANPDLRLVRASDQVTVAANDDWQAGASAAAIQGSGYAPADPREAAVLVTLEPGAYTAIVSGVGGASGVGIVEVFELDNPAVPLAGLSTRGLVLVGNEVMIGGFVIQGTTQQTVVVRAGGPSLVAAGVANALADPTLTLVRAADNRIVGSNDNWGTDANAPSLAASGLAPARALESALLVTLEPGAYTAIVSGFGNTTGVGIVEVFPVP